MIFIPEALRIIEREVVSLPGEIVELDDSVGRVLAQEIVADGDLPPFDRSQMDGFAVRGEETKNAPVKLKIVGEAVAGRGFGGEVKSGEAVRIMTGAPLPRGANAVQKVELTEEKDGFVVVLETVKPEHNLVKRAAEIRAGAKIFGAGEIVTEQMIAALASFGCARVEVYRKPRIAVLATGSEIVNVDETPQKDQIRNSNSAMLAAFAGKLNLKTEILPLVRDDCETLQRTIAVAVGLEEKCSKLDESKQFKVHSSINADAKSKIPNPKSQILILTGGVSVGDYDFTKPALRELGAEIFFEKVNLKPGKPTVFARLNDCLIFGLPGNPVSVAVTFYLFVRKAILRLQNAVDDELKKGFAVASGHIKGARERDSYLPVSVRTNEKGFLTIESVRFSGSSNFIAFARADALVFVPRGKTLEAGDVAEIRFL